MAENGQSNRRFGNLSIKNRGPPTNGHANGHVSDLLEVAEVSFAAFFAVTTGCGVCLFTVSIC